MATRILIVEDNFNLLTLLKTRLEMAGYHISLAQDGLEALAQLEAQLPDLILLDLAMPRMDGYTFLEELAQRKPGLSLPTIVLTADSQAAAHLAHRQVKVFLKPFSFHTLMTVIQESC
ncbi:MAG TPA: response regulator [Ktedonobacteraceae bacterium]|jgi:CheY-like chemotaxis protein|nr:response regulator [Ktedonobacteraceae bacterium]